MKERTLTGVEVDGTRVTVMESLGGLSVASRTVDLGDLAESMEVALSGVPSKKGSPPVRIGVVSAGTALRRMDVTAKVAASRAAFEEAVFELIPMAQESSAVAGLFFDPSALVGDAVSPGVAATVPLSTVSSVYKAIGDRPAELVPSPLLLSGHDGVWLGVHGTAVEAALVVGGFPVSFRQLRAGGLSAVASVLADEHDIDGGWQRLLSCVNGDGGSDAIADAELSRYARMLAAELAQTLDFWKRQGEDVPNPNSVLVYGVGAPSTALHNALAEYELDCVFPADFTEQMAYVAPSEREPGMLAFLASVTVGVQSPQAVLVNPEAEALALARRKRRSKAIRLGAVLAVVGAAVILLGVPYLAGVKNAADAASARAAVEAKAAPLEGVYHQTLDLQARKSLAETALAGEPRWSSVVKAVYSSKPEGVAVTRVSATSQPGAVLVLVDGERTGGSYQELSQWMGRLTTEYGARDAWSSGFSYVNGLATYQISFWLPTDAIPANRSATEAADAEPASTESGTQAPAQSTQAPATTVPSPGASQTEAIPAPTPAVPAPATASPAVPASAPSTAPSSEASPAPPSASSSSPAATPAATASPPVQVAP